MARVAGADDVAAVVNAAREADLELAVRSGGHSRPGYGTVDGGLVIDLSAMDGVEIDADARAAWVETGAKAGKYTLATSEKGRATGLGDTGSVGIGGIALAGGILFLVRKTGLTIDNLLAAEVVTADGEVVLASEDSEPDLFWAIRGGEGNFGIATRLKLRLVEISEIVGGTLILPASPEVITGFLDAANAAPDELSTIANVMLAPPLPFRAFRSARQAGRDGPVCLCRAGRPRRDGDRPLPHAREATRRHNAADAVPGAVRGSSAAGLLRRRHQLLR